MTEEKFMIPGVGGIIERKIDGEDTILVQKRMKDPRECSGVFEIPAGKIREYENIFDCLRREIKEETGLDLIEIYGENEAEIIEQGNYKVVNYEPFSCSQNTIGEYPIMVHTFICRASGDLLERSNESEEIQWVTLKELRRRLDNNKESFYPMHIVTLEKYLSWKSTS
ncbi:NUDIX hydrolase [Vallitalea okinawensis]|uniref:NUDIX hydrolase n=1 Tax=Vallitalea okinawensis TaxID=2078660 RepID=UPI001FA8B60E|nr:NUDIX domain-containing protein [Vallitalea okinawensis]